MHITVSPTYAHCGQIYTWSPRNQGSSGSWPGRDRLALQTSFTSLWSFWLASSDFVTSLLAAASCSSISPTWRDTTEGHKMTQIEPTWVSVNVHSTECKQTWRWIITHVRLVIVRLAKGIADISVTWCASGTSNTHWSPFILWPNSQDFKSETFCQLFIFTEIQLTHHAKALLDPCIQRVYDCIQMASYYELHSMTLTFQSNCNSVTGHKREEEDRYCT